jgi:hypothetical protein
VAAGGNGANVPDDWLLGVDIARSNEQEPPFPVSASQVGHHRVIEVTGYEAEQRLVVSKGVVGQRRDDAALDQHILGRDAGVDLAQLRVIPRAEVRKRISECTGADSSHPVEYWTGVPCSLQPQSSPAPNAPSAPPPETDSIS